MAPLFKRTGYALVGLLAVGLLLLGSLYVRGRVVAHRAHEVTPAPLSLASDSALLARGEHLSRTMGCRHCHGDRLQGAVFADDPPFRLTASNLTAGAGGVAPQYGRADWARAIRHGVGPEGRALIGMPSASYHSLSDRDLAALIAYLQQAPPVNHSPPPTRITPLGYLLIGAGQINVTDNVRPSRTHPDHVPVAVTTDHGAYLYRAACEHCHGAQLEGGPHPDPAGPPVPGLHESATWPLPAFKRSLAEGVTANGDSLRDKWMPWSAFRHLSDAEVEALYRYLQARTAQLSASPPPVVSERRGKN